MTFWQLLELRTYIYDEAGDTWYRSWLWHSAINRKVVGSIPDGIIGFFQLT
jgi:hypothetical protein